MSILRIASIFLLFALGSISADSKIRCIRDFNNEIDGYVQRVNIASHYFRSKIEERVNTFTNKKPIPWERNFMKLSNYGLPEVEFNGSNVEFKPVIEIDDSTCREFLQELSHKSMRRCKQYRTYSMSVDSMKIAYMAKNVLAYLDKVRQRVPRNEGVCEKKIKEADEVVKNVKNSMMTVFIRAENKAKNFVGDLSYCLLTQDDLNRPLFKKWYKACSYYTGA